MICPGCYNVYNRINNIPKDIPNCGHNICSKCLEYYFVNNNLICKICKEENFANNINDFLNNYDILNNLPKNPSLSIFNKNFENNEHINLNHNIIENYKNFEILSCELHNKNIEAFCNSCKKIICIKCMVGANAEHKKHDIIPLENAYNTEYDFFSKYYKKLKLMKNNYENFLKQNSNKEENLNQIKQKNLDSYDKIFDELVNKIKFEIDIQKNLVEEKFHTYKNKWNDNYNEINEKIINMNDFISKMINYNSPILYLKDSKLNHNELLNLLNFENKFKTKFDENILNKDINLNKELKNILTKICEDFDIFKKKINNLSNLYSNYSRSNKITVNNYKKATKNNNNKKSSSIKKNKLIPKINKYGNILNNKKKNNKPKKWKKVNKLNNIKNSNKISSFKVNFLKNERISDYKKESLFNSSNFSSNISRFNLNISKINKNDTSYYSIYDKCSVKSFSKNNFKFNIPSMKFTKSKNLKERTISSTLSINNLGHSLIFGGIKNDKENNLKLEVYNFSTKKTIYLQNQCNFYSMKIKNYNNLLYIFGGIKDGDYNENILSIDFNKIKNNLLEFDNIDDINFKRIYFAEAYYNHKIYLSGGLENDILSYSFSEFNFKTNQLTNNENMIFAKKFHSLTVNPITENIFSSGGVDLEGNVINKVEKFNAITDKWEIMSNMNCKRKSHSSIIINNKLYVFGGYDGLDYWDSLEEYNIEQNKWILMKLKLKTPKGFLQITLNKKEENIIYILGGYNRDSLYEVEKLDIIRNTTKIISKLKIPRYLHSVAFIPKEIKF